MSTVSVRYIVDDVEAAIVFYCTYLGFEEVMHPAPTFAMLKRGDLRLVLSAPGGGPGGGQAMPGGELPAPGGWNRFSVEVDDLDTTVEVLRASGTHFRNNVVEGVGGRQVLLDDPSGNPVELFQPTLAEARLDQHTSRPTSQPSYDVRPIGRVESTLVKLDDAPRQGHESGPDAWLVLEAHVDQAMRDLRPGDEVVVLTWLDRSRRDQMVCHPRNDASRPQVGVFSTRSPERPNPIGLHPVRILDVDGLRLHVTDLEAIDGTPVLDIKPALDTPGR